MSCPYLTLTLKRRHYDVCALLGMGNDAVYILKLIEHSNSARKEIRQKTGYLSLTDRF